MLEFAKELGDNVRLISQTEEHMVFQLTEVSGQGFMTLYQVFPGIYLLYNEFNLERCVSSFHPSMELFCIDHCREGRIEWAVDRDRYVYIEAGDMQVNVRAVHTGQFSFPLRQYQGLTIGFVLGQAERSLLHVMDGFSVDLKALKKKFCPDGETYIMRADRQIEHIFSELYHLPDRVRLSYFKIKVLELLLFLETAEAVPGAGERPYFCKSQVDKVKKIAAFLTADLERWHTLEELSQRFDFPMTAMKQCFRGVYGSSIYAYMKVYRMNAAALLLRQTDEPVVNIAGRVGYSNPSKFSTAFRSIFRLSPTDYRKSAV